MWLSDKLNHNKHCTFIYLRISNWSGMIHGGYEVLMLRLLQRLHLLLDEAWRWRVAVVAIDHCKPDLCHWIFFGYVRVQTQTWQSWVERQRALQHLASKRHSKPVGGVCGTHLSLCLRRHFQPLGIGPRGHVRPAEGYVWHGWTAVQLGEIIHAALTAGQGRVWRARLLFFLMDFWYK